MAQQHNIRSALFGDVRATPRGGVQGLRGRVRRAVHMIIQRHVQAEVGVHLPAQVGVSDARYVGNTGLSQTTFQYSPWSDAASGTTTNTGGI